MPPLDHVIQYVASDLPHFEGKGDQIIEQARQQAQDGHVSDELVEDLLPTHAQDLMRWSRSLADRSS